MAKVGLHECLSCGRRRIFRPVLWLAIYDARARLRGQACSWECYSSARLRLGLDSRPPTAREAFGPKEEP
jgi:hypothetical protein